MANSPDFVHCFPPSKRGGERENCLFVGFFFFYESKRNLLYRDLQLLMNCICHFDSHLPLSLVEDVVGSGTDMANKKCTNWMFEKGHGWHSHVYFTDCALKTLGVCTGSCHTIHSGHSNIGRPQILTVWKPDLPLLLRKKKKKKSSNA